MITINVLISVLRLAFLSRLQVLQSPVPFSQDDFNVAYI